MMRLRPPGQATTSKGVPVSGARIVLIALLVGACSAAQPTDAGDDHKSSSPNPDMQMHVFACDDGSSIVTSMGDDTFQVDVVGATREGREKLTAPRTSIRSANGRLTVTIGPDVLHLERINRQGINEHLWFKGKSCWR
mgnify:CR=1 FL=1